MDAAEKKRAVARAAAEAVAAETERGAVIGIGSGSTAELFIDALAPLAARLDGAVASSEASAARLASHGIRVLDLNDVDELPLYVDGADEADAQLSLIKGGGGALTREKIVAAASREFVCIVDDSKLVERLGAYPLPIEVVPMARALVCRRVAALGGRPEPRAGFVTDNGNVIVDVAGLDLAEPVATERRLNDIVGTVCNGLFAIRGADRLMIGTDAGVDERRA